MATAWVVGVSAQTRWAMPTSLLLLPTKKRRTSRSPGAQEKATWTTIGVGHPQSLVQSHAFAQAKARAPRTGVVGGGGGRGGNTRRRGEWPCGREGCGRSGRFASGRDRTFLRSHL